ncbi:MAG: ABC transporter substrate-binding protein, partial [Chloroflexota bacterium]
APAQTAAPAATGVSITYQQRSSINEDFVRKKYGPQFQKDTGIKVIIQDIPDAQIFEKLPILFAANQLGDLIFAWTVPWLPPYAAKGMLRAVDDYVAQDKYDLTQFYTGVIDACRLDGKLYALPTVGHGCATNIFFNRDLLDKAGITAPDAKSPDEIWKWDDLITYGKALTKVGSDGKVEIWGYMTERGSYLPTQTNLRAFGTDLIAPDGKTTASGNEQGKQMFQYQADLIYKQKISPGPTSLPTGVGLQQFFASGKLAVFQQAAAPITTTTAIVGDKFNWGAFIMPDGPGGSRGATAFGNTTSVTTQAKQPEAAWKFLQYICSHEVGVQKVLMGSGSPGARPDVYKDPRLIKPYPWFKVGDKMMQQAKAPNIASNNRMTEIESVIPQITDEIFLNKIDPAAGATKIQQAIQNVLGEAK